MDLEDFGASGYSLPYMLFLTSGNMGYYFMHKDLAEGDIERPE